MPRKLTCKSFDYDVLQVKDQLNNFQAFIDYRDIIDSDIVKLINEQALGQDNDYVKEAYMHDFLIQINLSTINGQTLKSDKAVVANIFFKVIFHTFTL